METESELEALRVSVQRGRPFRSDTWQKQTGTKLGLESTFQGSPREGMDHAHYVIGLIHFSASPLLRRIEHVIQLIDAFDAYDDGCDAGLVEQPAQGVLGRIEFGLLGF